MACYKRYECTLKMVPEQSVKNRDFINISILLIIALCIGIYLIANTVVIAKDGVTFIEYAKKFETAPVKTMVDEYQHPSYPYLIFAAHKVISFRYESTSVFNWIYCAQGVTLLFRLIAVVILYFIGKRLSGSQMSFWAVLVLIMLPDPAKFGSDALSDWPHICFLTAGLLLMLSGSCDRRFWLFGFAGLAGGIGYLVRPECVQLIIAGLLWLGLQLLWSKRIMSRGKVLCAIFLLIIGFLAAAGPYMKLKGAMFPKKSIGSFALQAEKFEKTPIVIACVMADISVFNPEHQKIIKALNQFIENAGETFVWFFVLSVIVGIYYTLRHRRWIEPENFFIIALIAFNVPLMVWLYCRYDYMSTRHTLPLFSLLCLYVSCGLKKFALWFRKIYPAKYSLSKTPVVNERIWFFIFLLVGFIICSSKLAKPIREEKEGYRAAAKWLADNTGRDDLIAVPDIRISFYAQRQGVVYEGESIPSGAVYVATESKGSHDITASTLGKLVYEHIGEKEKDISVTIYKK